MLELLVVEVLEPPVPPHWARRELEFRVPEYLVLLAWEFLAREFQVPECWAHLRSVWVPSESTGVVLPAHWLSLAMRELPPARE